MSKKIKAKTKKRILVLILILILLFILQAYILPVSSVLGKKLFRYIPLPAMFVNSKVVTLGEYFTRFDVSEQVKKTQLSTEQKQQLINQLVLNEIADNLVSAKGIVVSNKDVDSAYTLLKETTQKPELAKEYKLSDGQFKDWFVYPDVVKTKLSVWLASNKKLNKDAFSKYDLVMLKLDSGSEFDAVAIAYSEDALSAQLGGDLGYVSYKDIIPEYFSEIESVKDTKVHTAHSRYGIHIFKVLASDLKGPKDSKRYKVQQIFIKTGDFDQWLAAQKQSYTILRLVR
ncbi:MAG: peptidylprolyl isomerase [Candidatus Doudnabacteria bacterium]